MVNIGLRQRLAAVEQVEDGVAAVAHQHQGTLRQPAAQLQDHLPGPVGEFFYGGVRAAGGSVPRAPAQ